MAVVSNSVPAKFPQYLAGISCALGVFAFGASFGWSSPAGSQFHGENDYFVVSPEDFGWVASILNVGSAVSCLFIGYLMNFGRKRAMLLIIFPLAVGWGLIVWAQNYTMLLIGRFLLGFGGSYFIVCPQYTSEIAVKEIRGTLGSFAQLFFMMGILFSYIIGAVTQSLYFLNVICGALPFIFGLTFILMPESPSFLINKNQEEAGLKSLQWLRGAHYNCLPELDEIKPQTLLPRDQETSLKEAMGRWSTIKGLIITVGLVLILQMSGITPVLFYTKNIFDIAKVNISSDASSMIVGTINVVSTFLATLIMDKAGRKILLCISTVMMSICLFFLGLFFISENVDVNTFGWVPLASLSLYAVSFSIGLGPGPWIILSEVFSYEVKNVATSIVGTLSWLFAFTVSSTFIHLLNSIGTGLTFWLFGFLTILGSLFIYFVVPETKGKSLTEIQLLLAGKNSSR